MKILHTSDWHLGKKLAHFSRLEEQIIVLKELQKIVEEKEIDVVLIAGDLFDTYNPPHEAVDLFYKTLKKLSDNGNRLIVGIAGNHDSPDRIEVPNPLARECGIVLMGYPNTQLEPFELDSDLKVLNSTAGFLELKLPKYDYPLRLILTPYANEVRLQQYLGIDSKESNLQELLKDRWKQLADKYCDDKGVNVLMSHLFMIKKGGELIEESDDEKSILHVGGVHELHSNIIPKQIQYTALGHIHKHYVIDKPEDRPVVYSSSILSYSLNEEDQSKYVICFEVEPGKAVVYNRIELKTIKKLYQKKFESYDEAVKWLTANQDCYVEFSLRSDSYLKAEVSRSLYDLHDGILNIIPLIEQEKLKDKVTAIDLQKSRVDLFKEYFTFKKGVAPSEEIIDVLKEIL